MQIHTSSHVNGIQIRYSFVKTMLINVNIYCVLQKKYNKLRNFQCKVKQIISTTRFQTTTKWEEKYCTGIKTNKKIIKKRKTEIYECRNDLSSCYKS